MVEEDVEDRIGDSLNPPLHKTSLTDKGRSVQRLGRWKRRKTLWVHPSYLSIYSRNHFYTSYDAIPMMFHLASKRKGGQVRFTSLQTDALEKRFLSHKYLSPEDRRILAESLKLTDKQVKTWFQNRRAKWRRSNSISSTHTDIGSISID